ncbi:MAG: ATP-binding protein [Lentisphaerae bacterium]|nr:ATP-binding protein [Lentisphaerota bacterium]
MLIEFKVKNFRSIRDQQTFSLVAANSDKTLPDCVIDKPLKGLSGIQFLRGAAIYGANASGKSNVLLALLYLSDLVETSATDLKPGDPTGAEPFKLDPEFASKPSEFEVTFETDGIRYTYAIAVAAQRVVEEYLYAYPKGLPQCWCYRTYNDTTEAYEWEKPSAAFKRDVKLQEYTKENSLFLSVGAQFNHEQLTAVFNWFKSKLRFVHLGADDLGISPGTTLSLLEEQGNHDRILALLRSADIGITDIETTESELDIESIRAKIPPSVLSRILAKRENGKLVETQINLLHMNATSQPVAMDYEEEESSGTRRFFSLIGPWLDTLEKGYTVFIDEIDTSLHPLLVRALLKLLLCAKNNPNGAQVVFTTHNPVLLDLALLRRDQIWFTEKDGLGATHLYPLTDYKPRDKEAIAKRYLAGVYGGIPDLMEGLKL